MASRINDKAMNSDEGIIVEASPETLRKAAAKVLFEFNESIVNQEGIEYGKGHTCNVGDSIVFEEDIQPLPAQIVATKLEDDTWYVISTSEIPPGGYPTGRDATRAAQAEEKRLRILTEFLSKEAGPEHVCGVRDWKPDMKAEAVDVLSIIDKAKRRWAH